MGLKEHCERNDYFIEVILSVSSIALDDLCGVYGCDDRNGVVRAASLCAVVSFS